MSEVLYKVRPNKEGGNELWQVVKVIHYDDGHETVLATQIYCTNSFKDASDTADELNANED